jgi:diacylglycerol kinase (ATP)
MSVLGALVGTVMGGKRDQWRAGVPLCLAVDGEETRTADRFLVLATTLKRLPFGVKPFGPPREGLKFLDVDAPPQGGCRARFPALLAGKESAWSGRVTAIGAATPRGCGSPPTSRWWSTATSMTAAGGVTVVLGRP